MVNAGRPAPSSGGHPHAESHDWNDDAFVERWLEGQAARNAERRREFALIRSMIPRLPDAEFRYLNLGAGPGNLDEVLLEAFPGANATLVDFSLPLLAAARRSLERFGERVEYVQADLSSDQWAGAVSGPFDLVVSINAVHHLADPARIRALYSEVWRLTGHGGIFLNLDYVRPAHPSLAPLGAWASRDPEAGLVEHRINLPVPGTLTEQLGWLAEAGFNAVDVLWKDLDTALLCGIRDELHMPEQAHAASPPAHEHHD
jgi:tRNA (cmo5U34)-methyltransferase